MHTPGPLTVVIDDKWPFDILTKNANGETIFERCMPCHSSSDNKKEDAIACRHFKHAEQEKYSEINQRAIADEVLHAAAPDLLLSLTLVAQHIPGIIAMGWLDASQTDTIRAAISKATGGAS